MPHAMKVQIEIEAYELDDSEVPIGESSHITVLSHWNRDRWIVIDTGKNQYTVSGKALIYAIESAMKVV